MADADNSKPDSSQRPARAQTIGLVLGPLFLLATLVLPAPVDMSPEAWATLGMMLLMATWWATEAIPIPATALLPIVLIPALGIDSIKAATTPYANPLIFLFLGGFTIGLAMQRWNLHKRIALATLLAVGSAPRRQIAGFMLATAFLSMWVSNTATSIMMLPIGVSVINLVADNDSDDARRFAVALLLAIAYSASVGGIATLIGTPPNALLAGYLADNHDITVGFAQWMLLGVPVSAVMLVLIWWWLTRSGFDLGDTGDSGDLIRDKFRDLGPLSRGEKRVALVFIVTAAAWIFRPLLSDALLPWLNDTIIAIAAAIALFLIPVDRSRGQYVMNWEATSDMPWGVLLLFGGGLSMAGAVSGSGLAEWIAESLSVIGVVPVLLMVALVATVIIFLTEVSSNTATTAAFLPLMGALAVSQGLAPELLAVPAAIAASCAFMMPVATPPNAIVFASGHMKIGNMIRAGFVLNLAGIVVVTLMGYVLMGWVFGLG
ncbi:MAG: DASS family sodium-coupled anion symporter [Marinobacter sp.]|uniref:SLC13 family permease n=1 Tax=Marinobacter sp. TaxID=50741 RepID=UPI00299F4D01|nr:DASS family sodium-coupled anion symporter [Marinobacter sp.]MDX1634454.1 DASS family sodium-coupled anion symporter [Marinobacter sp.]